MGVGLKGPGAKQVSRHGRSPALPGTALPRGHCPLAVPPLPTALLSDYGMIGLDMFICCLLKVHFLGPSRRRQGGLEGLTVDQLPQLLYMQHKY